jgi:hypothetical protein
MKKMFADAKMGKHTTCMPTDIKRKRARKGKNNKPD